MRVLPSSASPTLEAITYLDADLMFFRDPEPVWSEFGDDSVLIVPHRYAPHLARLRGDER